MHSRTWKFSVLLILLVAMMVVAGCQSDLEKAAEATVEVQQEKIDTFFEVAEGHIVAATELANALPSQQAKADLILQDLEEINSRLNEAVEMEAEAKVTALEGVAQLIETVKGNVEDAVENAVDELPEEAQDALKELQRELEDLQKKIQDEVENVKRELGQEVEEAQETAEDAAKEAEKAVEEGVEEAQDEAEATVEAIEEEVEEEATPSN